MNHSTTSDYMAHGFCLFWEPRLVYLHVISDILTGVAYYSIPIALFYFVYKRRDLPFLKIFVLFGIFIFSCGTTHLLAAYTIYVPAYWYEGIVKAITAFVSIISAFFFIPMIPKAIAMPSLKKALDDITGLNKTLQKQLEEQKLAEEAKAESEERYRNLFDSTLDGIYRTNAEGVFTDINKACAGIFGYNTPDEMIGREVLQHWRDPKDRDTSMAELQRNKSVRSYPIKAVKKDGVPIELEASIRILEDKEGTLLGIEGILRDMTEQRKLEDQLLQAQKMEAVGTLAGGVAHDFNNILSTISGYGHFTLMKMEDNDPRRPNIEEMIAASERGATLTQSLLAFSRKQIINLVIIDINELLKRFEKLLRRLIREDIELKITYTEESLTVMADSLQIEQVLMNLVTNARDVMPNGGQLTIKTSSVDLDDRFMETHKYGKAGKYALLSVTDTGAGMDETTRQKIFEPFFTTKELGKGTGLGLAMVYGIIKKHEGFINVYSELNKGASFKIYLPLVDAVTPLKEEKGDKEPVKGGTETILLAEDDDSLRKMTTIALTYYGYAVIAAIDGAEAIEKFIENKDSIKLVILDGIMPRKNGKEAYNEIKILNPNIKTIFMSGYAEDIFTKDGVPQEKVAFILKPVAPTDLAIKVREILDA